MKTTNGDSTLIGLPLVVLGALTLFTIPLIAAGIISISLFCCYLLLSRDRTDASSEKDYNISKDEAYTAINPASMEELQ